MSAVVVAVLLAAASAPTSGSGVHVESSTRRGWLTGTGLVLAGGSLVALSLAIYDGLQADTAARTVAAYYANGAAPTALQAPRVRFLNERSNSASSEALVLAITGGAALALGLGLVLLDGWVGQATVSVAVQPSGASVLVRGRF